MFKFFVDFFKEFFLCWDQPPPSIQFSTSHSTPASPDEVDQVVNPHDDDYDRNHSNDEHGYVENVDIEA